MDLLDRLLEHGRWATDHLLELSRGLTDAQLDQPFDIGHETLRATFEHMIFNTEAWTAVMRREPVVPRRDERSLEQLIDRQAKAQADFAAVSRHARDKQRLDETFTDHFDGQLTYGSGTLHVVLHNAEHRGEALHILNRLGVSDVPEIDLALWDFVRRGMAE